MKYLVQFTKGQADQLTKRWRTIEGSGPENAAVEALRTRRTKGKGEVLKRCGFLWAWVAAANGPKHESGMPMVVHSYKLEFH